MNWAKKLILSLVVLTLSLCSITACSPASAGPQVNTLTASEVQSFSDPIAENILQSLNKTDYAGYTADFDEQAKKNLPEGAFKTVNATRIDTVGTYESKDFWQMVQKNDKVEVAYRTFFTKEPATVYFTVYFKNIDGKWLVDGLHYDSPLMRAANC